MSTFETLGINSQWKSAGSVGDLYRMRLSLLVILMILANPSKVTFVKAGGDAGVEGDPYIQTDVPEIDKASARNKIRLYLEKSLPDDETWTDDSSKTLRDFRTLLAAPRVQKYTLLWALCREESE
ncbi:hypothetical protein H0H93_016664 [Arthromyces matolae]|nr:hypothetical protein H0H93_016664 [Arthromyces matolae]